MWACVCVIVRLMRQLRDAFHSLLEAVAGLLKQPDGDHATPTCRSVQLLALQCWRTPLLRSDDDFLHSSAVFGILRDVIGREDEAQWQQDLDSKKRRVAALVPVSEGVEESKEPVEEAEGKAQAAPTPASPSLPTVTAVVDVSKHERVKIDTSNGDDRVLYLTDAGTGELLSIVRSMVRAYLRRVSCKASGVARFVFRYVLGGRRCTQGPHRDHVEGGPRSRAA